MSDAWWSRFERSQGSPRRRQRGATTLEYLLMGALLAVGSLSAVSFLGVGSTPERDRQTVTTSAPAAPEATTPTSPAEECWEWQGADYRYRHQLRDEDTIRDGRCP